MKTTNDDNGENRRSASAVPDSVQELIHAAAAEVRSVNCFDFVPSDYEAVWEVLCEIRRRFAEPVQPAFCEWGSGLGVVTGMAEIPGFRASGIEIDATLAEQSRELLQRHGLQATIATGSYLEMMHTSDVIFSILLAEQNDGDSPAFYRCCPGECFAADLSWCL